MNVAWANSDAGQFGSMDNKLMLEVGDDFLNWLPSGEVNAGIQARQSAYDEKLNALKTQYPAKLGMDKKVLSDNIKALDGLYSRYDSQSYEAYKRGYNKTKKAWVKGSQANASQAEAEYWDSTLWKYAVSEYKKSLGDFQKKNNKFLEEVSYYEKAKTSNKLTDWKAYLKLYPEGQFVGEANSAIASLTTKAPASSPKEEELNNLMNGTSQDQGANKKVIAIVGGAIVLGLVVLLLRGK